METVDLSNAVWAGQENESALDRALHVRFYMKPVLNKRKSWGGVREWTDRVTGQPMREVIEAQGRPIYDSVEYVTISSPGDRLNVVDKPATIHDKRRFPRHYEAFKKGAEQSVSGTPLAAWPLIQAHQVAELSHFHVNTVEGLADMPDGNIPNVGSISTLKQQAKDYLLAAKGQAPVLQMRGELEAQKLRADMLERQLQELIAAQAKQAQQSEDETPRRGPGRPRKEANAEL